MIALLQQIQIIQLYIKKCLDIDRAERHDLK